IEGCAFALETVGPGTSTVRFRYPPKEIEAEALATLRLLLGQRAEQVLEPIGRHAGPIILHDQLKTAVPCLPQAKLHHGSAPRVLEDIVEHLVERGFEQRCVTP